jgi:hypothetical protein
LVGTAATAELRVWTLEDVSLADVPLTVALCGAILELGLVGWIRLRVAGIVMAKCYLDLICDIEIWRG